MVLIHFQCCVVVLCCFGASKASGLSSGLSSGYTLRVISKMLLEEIGVLGVFHFNVPTIWVSRRAQILSGYINEKSCDICMMRLIIAYVVFTVINS